VLRPGPEVRQTCEPKRVRAPFDFNHIILENLDATFFKSAPNSFAVVPPVMISQHSEHAQRRVKTLQMRGRDVRLDSMAVPTVRRHVIAEQDN